MAESSRPAPVASLAGVYESDAFCPPIPPVGARAVEIHDESGAVIGFGWAVAEHAEALPRVSWEWLERVTRGAALRLME